MKNNLYTKYMKRNWILADDGGRGKSPVSKARNRRILKKLAKRAYLKDMASE